MRDEIDSRIWVEHHAAFTQAVANFLAAAATTLGSGFQRLNEIQFDAPWKRDLGGPGHA
jgi:hypothetical protein